MGQIAAGTWAFAGTPVICALFLSPQLTHTNHNALHKLHALLF